MRFDFHPLQEALRRARSAGYAPAIWWRDDDAIEPTPALEQLQSLAESAEVPVHLAIIPKLATRTLPEALSPDLTVPLVHGWAHENHSHTGAKKAEFGQTRPGALAELEDGLKRMSALFPTLQPVFVPPWNRIAEAFLQELPRLGYRALSTFTDRKQPLAAPDLWQINTHVDPIFWKGTRDLVSPEELVARTVSAIDARLEKRADPSEPIGLLTHHLVHSPAIWDFSKRWLVEMQAGGAIAKPKILEP